MIENFAVDAALDQTVGGDGQRLCQTAVLLRGDRDIGAIGPAGAQRADAFDIVIAGSDVDELRMRLDDDVGPARGERQKACRFVVIILQFQWLQPGCNIFIAPPQQDALLIGAAPTMKRRPAASSGFVIEDIALSDLTKKPCNPCR